jgi:hypothetical protein
MELSAWPNGIDAPAAAAGDENIEKDKAKRYGELAFVFDRVKTTRRVDHEVGDGHFTRQDERGQSREESKREEKAAEELNPAGDQHERGQTARVAHRMVRRREVEEFLRAVLEQEKPDDDTKDAEKDRLPALQE